MAQNSAQQFVEEWERTHLKETASAQSHFEAVCRLVGHALPHEIDPDGAFFTYEYGVEKAGGGQGFADVWYKGHFAIEYKGKGKYKTLEDAYQQLLQYREALHNPPLLIVCDIENWEIHTNFPNTQKKVYAFINQDIARPEIYRILKAIFNAPDALHPNRSTAQVTTEAAEGFRKIADNMRSWQADPERIASFLTKLVFCLFAEDTNLLPAGPKGEKGIFTEIVEATRREPGDFVNYTQQLFRAMADGGQMLFRDIPYFDGLLFENVEVEELSLEALGELERVGNLDWSAVEPAIFGTLFERSLDPAKRAQLGAHYTSRDDILLIVEPVLMQPLRREWAVVQQEAVPIREQYEAASTTRIRQNRQRDLEALREGMLDQLRSVTVLDPACGSGNFLYVALQLLKDMEKVVITHALWAGLPMPFPEVHPRQLYGIETNAIAHALTSIVVWIGYIQWHINNGYLQFNEPILEPLDNIRLMDAILGYEGEVPTPGPSPTHQGGESLEESPAQAEIQSPHQPLPNALGRGWTCPGLMDRKVV